MKNYTLEDAIKLGGARDITDNTFDYMVYFDYSEEPHDSFDRVMKWMAHKIIVTGADEDVINCNISEFITKNLSKFKRFAKHVYNSWFYNEYFTLDITSDDEEFYDTYLSLFDDMVCGRLSIDDYQWFIEKILTK